MAVYGDSHVSLYFGDSSDQLFMQEQTYNTFQQANQLINIEPFSKLHTIMQINTIMFPRQTHSTTGFLVNTQQESLCKPFSCHGDYLITQERALGLGILTADCLPILMHDTAHQAIAAIHAGWRGSVAGIAVQALKHMHQAFGSKSEEMRVFFGPCARSCCYSVGQEVIAAVNPCKKQVLKYRDNQVFFDLIAYNRIQLEKAGVNPTAFSTQYAQCTICSTNFWSYRRQQHAAGRQMTVICLK